MWGEASGWLDQLTRLAPHPPPVIKIQKSWDAGSVVLGMRKSLVARRGVERGPAQQLAGGLPRTLDPPSHRVGVYPRPQGRPGSDLHGDLLHAVASLHAAGVLNARIAAV